MPLHRKRPYLNSKNCVPLHKLSRIRASHSSTIRDKQKTKMNKYTNITFNNNLLIWINLRNSLWTIWTCLHCIVNPAMFDTIHFKINENTFNKWNVTVCLNSSSALASVFEVFENSESDCFLVHFGPVTKLLWHFWTNLCVIFLGIFWDNL